MEAGGKDRPPMLAPDKVVPVSEGSPETTTVRYMETYKNVLQDIRNQLNAKAKAVQIILTMIDNDIYFTVDTCPNACEMWKAIERSQQATTRNRGKAIVNSPLPIYDQEPSMVAEDDEMSKDKKIDKLMALISLSFKKIYKTTNNNLQTSSNTSRANQDNSPRINRGSGYDNQSLGNVVGARENVEQADWRDDTDDESEDKELEAHYMYMAQIQEVSPNADDSGPIFDSEPVQKKSQAELERRNDVKYASKVEINCAKAKGDLISYKMESQKSFNKYTRTINDLNQTISEMKKKLSAHQETIPILSQQKEVQIKLYKTREDKELDKVIALENKVKVFDNIVYKTGQSVQTMKCLIVNVERVLQNLSSSRKLKERILVYSLKSQLETQKTQFLNEIDRLLKEYYYADHMNAILGLYTELDESQEFCKEREQYFEIQDLKAQLQDKGIEISELNKLIEKLKGKSVDTKFRKSSVIRQPNAFKSQRSSILGKPTIFSDSLERKDFSKSNLNAKTLNVNFVCATCHKCVLNEKHDMCVLKSHNDVNSSTKMPIGVPVSSREPKCIVEHSVAKPIRKTVASETTNQKPRNITRKLYEHVSKACSWWYPKFTPPGYKWKPKSGKENVNPNLVEIVLFIVDSGCSKHMTGNIKILINFVEKFLGLNHNLFFVGQFCDADLEVAFWKSTCYIRDLKENDLLTGSRGADLYSITLQNITSPNPICLMAKVTSSQAWLWHRRLSHLNFDTINLLSKNDIVVGLPKLNSSKIIFVLLVSWGKPNESLFKLRLPQALKDSYNFYTWTYVVPCGSKDETPEVLIVFLRLVQRGLHAQVTEFLNKTLHAYFASKGILHQTSVARTPEQNSVVKRRNRTLVEAA
nr:hypothetical protein [Tanacetum cinerariifolium]